MAGQQAFLMRAFRSADGSYHTWRAGQYDPLMAEATGSQAPPFPPGDYSDFMVVSFLGGPLARTDGEAAPLSGLGTSGAPITFNIFASGLSLNSDPGLDCRDFSSVTVWVVLTNQGTASSGSLFAGWSGKDAAAFLADVAIQKSDDAISGGISPQNVYVATVTLPTPVGVAPVLGPYNVPVRGRRFFFGLYFDTADVEGYVIAQRFA
jgi:hypothetical protein